MMSVVKVVMHVQAWLVGHVNNSLESCNLAEIGKKKKEPCILGWKLIAIFTFFLHLKSADVRKICSHINIPEEIP